MLFSSNVAVVAPLLPRRFDDGRKSEGNPKNWRGDREIPFSACVAKILVATIRHQLEEARNPRASDFAPILAQDVPLPVLNAGDGPSADPSGALVDGSGGDGSASL